MPWYKAYGPVGDIVFTHKNSKFEVAELVHSIYNSSSKMSDFESETSVSLNDYISRVDEVPQSYMERAVEVARRKEQKTGEKLIHGAPDKGYLIISEV